MCLAYISLFMSHLVQAFCMSCVVAAFDREAVIVAIVVCRAVPSQIQSCRRTGWIIYYFTACWNKHAIVLLVVVVVSVAVVVVSAKHFECCRCSICCTISNTNGTRPIARPFHRWFNSTPWPWRGPPVIPLGGLGSAVSSPSGIRGKVLATNSILCITSSKFTSGGIFFVIFMLHFMVVTGGWSHASKPPLARGLGTANVLFVCT